MAIQTSLQRDMSATLYVIHMDRGEAADRLSFSSRHLDGRADPDRVIDKQDKYNPRMDHSCRGRFEGVPSV